MYSTFNALEIAQRALHTQQAAISVTGHNISNANTEGYSRQLPGINTSYPLTFNGSNGKITMGTGALLDGVHRARDSYIDNQFRWETSKFKYWEEIKNSLDIVEGVLNEPSDFSLSSDLSAFWNSWSRLADDTENMGARDVLCERALTLVNSFHQINRQFTDLEHDLNENTRVIVRQINNYAAQIAELNKQIKRAEVARDNPNDLEDQRDQLIDKIAELVPVKVEKTRDPNFTDRDVYDLELFIASEPPITLVKNHHAHSLGITQDGEGKWQLDEPMNMGNEMGKLMAVFNLRDNYLPEERAKLDLMAQNLAKIVNAIHSEGQGMEELAVGRDFFVSSSGGEITMGNITVNSELVADPLKIATGEIASPMEAGDNRIAIAISSLSQGFSQEILTKYFGGSNPIGGVTSLGEYYGSTVASLGVDVQQAKRMTEGQRVLVSHMGNQRESFSGVSLDEEMTNMIKFQKGYSAAARFVTVLDSMFDQILGMGVTR